MGTFLQKQGHAINTCMLITKQNLQKLMNMKLLLEFVLSRVCRVPYVILFCFSAFFVFALILCRSFRKRDQQSFEHAQTRAGANFFSTRAECQALTF